MYLHKSQNPLAAFSVENPKNEITLVITTQAITKNTITDVHLSVKQAILQILSKVIEPVLYILFKEMWFQDSSQKLFLFRNLNLLFVGFTLEIYLAFQTFVGFTLCMCDII